MSTTLKLRRDECRKSVDQKLHKSIIGSLLYLTASRHDISFSMGACARFLANPKVCHLAIVKRIIKYVVGTCDYGMWYPFDSNKQIVGFTDVVG